MRFIFLISTLFIGVLGSAQPGISLTTSKSAFMGGEERSVYKLLIYDAAKNDVLKGLESRLEKGTKQKAMVDKSSITIEKVVYKNYWSDSLVIVSEVVEVSRGVLCNFAVDLDSIPVDSNSNKELDTKVKRYLKRFGVDMYAVAVKKELKIEEKSLKHLEKDFKSALKAEDKQIQKINNERLAIANTNEAIDINSSDQESKIEEMQVQKGYVSKASGDEKAIEKEKLKAIKSELKKLKKENKKLNKDVFKRRNHIRDIELEVEKIKTEQAELKERIEDQQEKIKAIHQKQFAIEDALKDLN